jgi:hypothetical protein
MMRNLLIIFGMMTLLSVSVAFAMVEMYRIEMDSYDSRVIAFYSEYFDFIQEQSTEQVSVSQTELCATQQNLDQNAIM